VPQAVPLHPGPETLQLTTRLGFELGAGVSVAVNCAVVPLATAEGPRTVKVNALVMLSIALAAFEGSAALVAVRVTLAGVGRICGAVNSPLESMVPHAAPAQPGPATLQLTAVLDALLTVAVNFCVAPNATDAVEGTTLTLTDGGSGGGGGGPGLAPPPPQPIVPAPAVKIPQRKTVKQIARPLCALFRLALVMTLPRARTVPERNRAPAFAGLAPEAIACAPRKEIRLVR